MLLGFSLGGFYLMRRFIQNGRQVAVLARQQEAIAE
jgi:hypothetical protein